MADTTDIELDASTPLPVVPVMATPSVVPSVGQVMQRLRLDDDLALDVENAIPEAQAEAQSILERRLYASEADLVAAADPCGLVVTADITAAMLLLIDAAVGANRSDAAEVKRGRAEQILLRRAYRGV